MGSCCGKCCQTNNKYIEDVMEKEKRRSRKNNRLLLLGIGSSGKSTIFRQLKVIYKNGIDEHMMEDVHSLIRQNIIKAVIKLLYISEELSQRSEEYATCKVNFEDENTNKAIKFIVDYHHQMSKMVNDNDMDDDDPDTPYLWANNNNNNNNTNNNSNTSSNNNTVNNHNNNMYNSSNQTRETIEHISFELAKGQIDWEQLEDLKQCLIYLWDLKSVKETYRYCKLFSFPDNMLHFLDKIDLIFSEDYEPNNIDVLKSRIRTAGIIEEQFYVSPQSLDHDSNNFNESLHHKPTDNKQLQFTIIDVGGQRNERRKWIHSFQGCTAVIFVAALNHYCSRLYEDESRIAMHESLILFGEIFGSKWFRQSEMILFLNKHDLFCENIKDTPLSVCFSKECGWYGDQWNGPDYNKIKNLDQFKEWLKQDENNNIIVNKQEEYSYNEYNDNDPNKISNNNNNNNNTNKIVNKKGYEKSNSQSQSQLSKQLSQQLANTEHIRQISDTQPSITLSDPIYLGTNNVNINNENINGELLKTSSEIKPNVNNTIEKQSSLNENQTEMKENDNNNGGNNAEYRVNNMPVYDQNANSIFNDDIYAECHRRALEFIATQYAIIAQAHNESKPQFQDKRLFTHVTTATSKDAVKKVFWDVQAIIIRKNLMKGGLGGQPY